MKNYGVYLVALMLGLGACDEESSDEGMGATDGTDPSAGESNGGGACEQESPQGDACEDGDDCTVACLCGESVVNSGRCVNGGCADPVDTCAQACEDFDAGDFSGSYCALDNAGDDTPPDDDGSDDGAGVCVPTGDTCEVNGDCCGFDGGNSLCTAFDGGLVACADVCVFDIDCVSNCCVPVDAGLGVCGPATECG